MYLSSDTALLNCQRENAVRKGLCSDARRRVAAEMAVQGRVDLFQNIMSPEDIALSFGPNLGHDAMELQDQSFSARASVLSATSATVLPPMPTHSTGVPAPKSVSLNGTPSQVNGCAWAIAPPVLVGPDPIPTMPLRAPVVVETPIGPAAYPPPTLEGLPTWINLCWAIRNGAVDPSQFEPSEYATLLLKCAQLGYTGACPPPPNTQAYLDDVRRHKAPFPHIQVTSDLLNSLPQAPTNIGACQDSYQRGGLSGIEPSWGDAMVSNGGATPGADGGVVGWFQSNPWWALALAAGGAVALSRRGR
jgi:hypothetical protein